VSHRPKLVKRKPARKIKQNKPILTITKKKKPVKAKIPVKKYKPRKAKIGLSKMRRGQLAMRPEDQHEKNMVKRLRSKTGMTHIQVMNLVKLAKKSDYIDIETEIMGSAGHSREKTETYEYAKNRILNKLDRQGIVKQQSQYNDPDYFDRMQDEWQHQMEWERQAQKFRKKHSLV